MSIYPHKLRCTIEIFEGIPRPYECERKSYVTAAVIVHFVKLSLLILTNVTNNNSKHFILPADYAGANDNEDNTLLIEVNRNNEYINRKTEP